MRVPRADHFLRLGSLLSTAGRSSSALAKGLVRQIARSNTSNAQGELMQQVSCSALPAFQLRATSPDRGICRYRRPWERWWGGAPRVRVRKLDDRQREQLAELAILNERLAGNQSPAARRRIEWLKLRRKEWEQIYNYVTKRDAAVSLAMIEEANRQASCHCLGLTETATAVVSDVYDLFQRFVAP